MQMVLGLGSNLGCRLAQLRNAACHLQELPETVIGPRSMIYESLAIGPPQPSYLNAAIRLRTTLSPLQMLEHAQKIERICGRRRKERWGPRTLDIDILWVRGGPITHSRLQIPHPHLRQRAFALAPLLDVAPELGWELNPILASLGGRPSIYCYAW